MQDKLVIFGPVVVSFLSSFAFLSGGCAADTGAVGNDTGETSVTNDAQRRCGSGTGGAWGWRRCRGATGGSSSGGVGGSSATSSGGVASTGGSATGGVESSTGGSPAPTGGSSSQGTGGSATGGAPGSVTMVNPAPGSKFFIGANFWNIDWEGSGNYFQTGVDFATTTNPWRPEFLSDLAPYAVLRFMDWNQTNMAGNPQAVWSTRKQKTQPQNEPVAFEW